MDSKNDYAAHYRELRVYAPSRELSNEIFEFTKGFPKDERYSLTDQIRRSSRSIGAQIAEAWGKRYYERHFVSKLTDADGEQLETQHWIKVAQDCSYFSKESADELLNQYARIGGMLGSMISKSASFRIKPTLKNETPDATSDTEY